MNMMKSYIVGLIAGGLIYILASSAFAQTATNTPTVSPTTTISPTAVVPSQGPSTGHGGLAK